MNRRIKITKVQQRDFLKLVKNVSGMNWEFLGNLCGVTGRTLREWAKAQYTISEKAGLLFSKKFGVKLPNNYKVLEKYWYIKKYARIGAMARYKLYGPPGNIETRRQGGFISQQLRRENPEKYRLLGCNVPKEIRPLEYSADLAELCGILLGDGGITSTQVSVTLNKNVDKEYSRFVYKFFLRIFKEKPYQKVRQNVIVFVLSGVNLVKALEKIGLKRGNKVVNQVGIPNWIMENPIYAQACLRGLVDTDGCVYIHNHTSGGKRYINVGLNFCNHSQPLLNGVNKILKSIGIKSSLVLRKGVYIYSLRGVKKYFEIIGSSNFKHLKRFKRYLILKGK